MAGSIAGSIANNNLPLGITLTGVPAGNYALIVYSVGFSFEQHLRGGFPTRGGRELSCADGSRATEFIANPTLLRMIGTNLNNQARGNYVMFENVSPAPDGTFVLMVTPQSTNVDWKRPALGAGAAWAPATGVPNPIAAAGSTVAQTK
ncbi:MAG: hypothetical protein ACXW3L_07505 [Limisphaerales bacterium]